LSIAPPLSLLPRRALRDILAPEQDRCWLDGTMMVAEVWLVGVERLSKSRWLARLRLDDQDDGYEVDILPGDAWDVVRTPKNVSYVPYDYDLMGLLERMHAGERFALPFKLRPRWPTPPDPPALP
jgi:hypothetical protein